MDTADHLRDASPWRHEPDPVKLAILGKLAEELGELQAAVARCIIQGADGAHPVTSKPNLDWLFEEIADVHNMLEFVHRAWQLTPGEDFRFKERVRAKRNHIWHWIASIDEEPLPGSLMK